MGFYAQPISANAQTATVATSQTSTAITFGDLATVGPAVTLVVGGSGLVFLTLTAQTFTSVNTEQTYMGFAASVGNTIAASISNALSLQPATAVGSTIQASYSMLLTGLTPGSTTFTAKYRTQSGNSSTWLNRIIVAIPL